VLRGIGAPVTQNNLALLRAWQQAEGGGTANNANFNPLNTTQGAKGASSINSVGVKSYRSAQQGIQATVQTLLNGYYGPIIAAMRNDAHPNVTASAIAKSPWGTGSGVLRVLGSGPVSVPSSSSPSRSVSAVPKPVKVPGPAVYTFKPPKIPDMTASLTGGLEKIAQGWSPTALLESTGQDMLKGLLQPSRLGVSHPPVNAPGMPGARPPREEASVSGKQGGFGVVPVSGKVIGTPYHGTHTLGDWESDNAVDIATPVGTPIRAIRSGVIGPQFGSLGKGGQFAGLRLHLVGKANEWYYAHLSRFAPGIKPGARVKAGQVIGYSGEANGVAHLHLGAKNGNPLRLYQ